MAAPMAFTQVTEPQAHFRRRKEILAKYPDIKDLAGAYRPTAFVIVLLVAAQLALAFFLRDQPVWLIFVSAYLVGAVISHALYVMIHEAAHNLVLKSEAANKVMGIVANLPTVIPSAISFRKYHLLHHTHLGEPHGDADVPAPLEARLVGRSSWRKALWLSLFWLAQAFRPRRVRRAKLWDVWTVTNLIVMIAVNVAVWIWIGPLAFLFLAASTFFGLGLHPLGGRWIQEHFTTEPGQETYSYYGPANLVAFNMGYHNEHHDMMNVPWVHLPKIKARAPEYYDSLKSYKSWTAVVLRFIFDPKMSPYTRMVRPDRA